MCNKCEDNPDDVYSNWLIHHTPYDLTDSDKEFSIRDQAIDVLLTLRFESITVEEIMSNYHVTEDRAREMSRVCNAMLGSMEDVLISMLNH